MVATKTKINQKGQMLAETAVAITLLGTVLGGCLYLSYLVIAFEWIDFWSYRTLICTAEKKNAPPCQKHLEEKLSLLLLKKHYRIDELWITQKEIQIKVHVQLPLYVQHTFQKKISLPLRSF